MHHKYKILKDEFRKKLVPLVKAGQLPGISQVPEREAYLSQLIDSVRRVDYVLALRKININPIRADPTTSYFDPIKAAIRNVTTNEEEACWLIFIATHCGRHTRDGWELARRIYQGPQGPWTWKATCESPDGLANAIKLMFQQKQLGVLTARFGNHRKYETLDPNAERNSAAAIKSYLDWVAERGSHKNWIKEASSTQDGFDHLYRSMNVISFGRTAKFDYLTMLAKTGLTELPPRSPYFLGATGPLRGARLLFQGDIAGAGTARQLEANAQNLGTILKIGMQEMEDSLCNWQKSPTIYIPFRG